MTPYETLAGRFNVGATRNIGQGAVGNFLPPAETSWAQRKAYQDFLMSRMQGQRGIADIAYGLRKEGMNADEGLNALDIANLGLSGYGAYKGYQQKQEMDNLIKNWGNVMPTQAYGPGF